MTVGLLLVNGAGRCSCDHTSELGEALTWCLGRPTIEGKTARGASSPAKPALTKPEPLSHTRAVVSSSSHILGRKQGAERHKERRDSWQVAGGRGAAAPRGRVVEVGSACLPELKPRLPFQPQRPPRRRASGHRHSSTRYTRVHGSDPSLGSHFTLAALPKVTLLGFPTPGPRAESRRVTEDFCWRLRSKDSRARSTDRLSRVCFF